MTASLDAGYTKPLKYSNKLNRTPTYIVAIVLNSAIISTIGKNGSCRMRRNRQLPCGSTITAVSLVSIDAFRLRNMTKAIYTVLWEHDYRNTTGLPRRPPTRNMTKVIYTEGGRRLRLKMSKDELRGWTSYIG